MTRLTPTLRWRVLALLLLPPMVLLATGGFTDDTQRQRKAGIVYLDCAALNESSGIALSTRDAEILWTHNDSGDRARLFAVNRMGKLLAEVHVDGAKSADWEDLCSFEMDGRNWLAVGDVGDNEAKRKNVEIYVIEEPRLDGQQRDRFEVKAAMELTVKYSTGPVNCEALAFDPLLKQFVLCSKETFRTRLFQVPIPKKSGKHESVAEQFGELALPIVTAADISRDGRSFVFATYGPGGVLQRTASSNPSTPKWDTTGESCLRSLELPARKQGESICFDSSNNSLILTSEGVPTPLLFAIIPSLEKLP